MDKWTSPLFTGVVRISNLCSTTRNTCLDLVVEEKDKQLADESYTYAMGHALR